MPSWAGKWKGGRYYLDERKRPVYFIESSRPGIPRAIKLQTHDEDLANSQLVAFRADPHGFLRSLKPPETPETPGAVFITSDRIKGYLAAINHTVADHRNARRSYLVAWSEKGLDLRAVDRTALREALSGFKGGHRGRVEALNAFARWLVREEELPAWNPLMNTRPTKASRAEREAYSLEDLEVAFGQLPTQPLKDLFYLRVATGMHHTEIEQLEGCKVQSGPLPDKGVWIRELKGEHEIQGVIQVRQKTKPRHRISVNATALRVALRLRAGVPSRFEAWNAMEPLGVVPSNLRHTFTTLSGEVGQIISYKSAGVSLDQIAEILGHRVGSKMTAARYDKLQIPKLMRLPLEWNVL